jgi:GNAT superfamily N-acetyltransferase
LSGVSEASLTDVTPDQRGRAISTLTFAFAADPVMRWMWPTTAGYARDFPLLVSAFGGKAFESGTVWSQADLRAVALWLPPGVESDGDAIVGTLLETVATVQHDDLLSVLEQMDAAHPTYPHWYLPWFGVDPIAQNVGLGSSLMQLCLPRVDADRLPAYLETPNPRNVPFYERHGFEVQGRAQAGDCPPVIFMRRAAR